MWYLNDFVCVVIALLIVVACVKVGQYLSDEPLSCTYELKGDVYVVRIPAD